jgi:hypothetical protein
VNVFGQILENVLCFPQIRSVDLLQNIKTTTAWEHLHKFQTSCTRRRIEPTVESIGQILILLCSIVGMYTTANLSTKNYRWTFQMCTKADLQKRLWRCFCFCPQVTAQTNS